MLGPIRRRTATESQTLGFLCGSHTAARISPADRAAAMVPAATALRESTWNTNRKRLRLAVLPAENAVVARALYPLTPLHKVSASEPYARMPPWMEADPTDTDAPISVWWDYPP